MNGRGTNAGLVGGVGLLVGLGLGAAGAQVLFGGLEPPPPPATRHEPALATTGARAGVDAELAAALRELRGAIASLEERLAVPHEPVMRAATETRAPVEASSGGDESLANALNAIAIALERSGARGGSAAAGFSDPGLRVPAYVDREIAFSYLDLRGLLADEELYEPMLDDLRRRHLFWTQQAVLETYGRPDSVDVGDGCTSWTYNDCHVLAGEGAMSVWFQFHEGLVFNSELDYTTE